MPIWEESIYIQAPSFYLFQLIHEDRQRREWEVFFSDWQLIGGAERPELGESVKAVKWWEMTFEYAGYNPPRVSALQMVRGPWFLEKLALSYRLEEDLPGRTEVIFKCSWTGYPRGMGIIVDFALMPLISSQLVRQLQALQRYAEENYSSSHFNRKDT